MYYLLTKVSPDAPVSKPTIHVCDTLVFCAHIQVYMTSLKADMQQSEVRFPAGAGAIFSFLLG